MQNNDLGTVIKEIRQRNNLTQKDLADKYHITCQAVSKWENNMSFPDLEIIKLMCQDFNLDLSKFLDGQYQENKSYKKIVLFIICFLMGIVIAFLIIFFYHKEDFEFKTLATNCQDFNISGSIAYNKKKSAIYITNIKYCGKDEKEYYKSIECTLYETNGNLEKKISSYKYNEKDKITLEDFLEMVTLSVDDYEKTCKDYAKDS